MDWKPGKPSERTEEETATLHSSPSRFKGCDVRKGRSHTNSSVSEDLDRNLIPKEGRGGNEAAPECSSPLSSHTGEENVMALKARITWCAVGSEEKRKCDQWSRVSVGKITCISCTTTEQCIFSITVGSQRHTCCGQWAS